MPTVDTVADWVTAAQPMWRRADDLLGGTDAMRLAAEAHLPRFEGEPDPNYKTRLNSTVLNNFYRTMMLNMVGVMTADPVTLEGSSLPEEFLNDVDRQGRDLNAFAAHHLSMLLTRGALHILTDYPLNPGVQTLAEQRAAGLRPYWCVIPPANVVDAFTASEAGVERITHVRWKETATKLGPDFARVTVETIRVLNYASDGVSYEVWTRDRPSADYQQQEGGARPLRAERDKSLPEITWVPILADRREGWRSIAPLDDVAHKNIEHWGSASDQRNILRVSRYPMRVEIGTQAPIRVTGPGMTLHSQGRQSADNQDVVFSYIEPEGTGIAAGERDLAQIVQDAEMLGVRLLAKPMQRAASDAAADLARDKSPLQNVAKTLEDGLQRALQHVALWYGMEPAAAGTVKVPRDFGVSADEAKAIETLLKMRAAGDISRRTLWSEARQLGYLTTDFDHDEEDQRIQDEDDRALAAAQLPAREPDPNAA
jgi:hypothetical protein